MTCDTDSFAPRSLAFAVTVLLLCPGVIGLSGCGKHDTQLHNLSPQEVQASDCNGLKNACSSAGVSCSNSTTAKCVDAANKSYTGFCHVAGGAAPCVNGALTDDYKAYCKVEACFGTAEADCLAEGSASCQKCGEITPIVKDCPGWSTSQEKTACDTLNPTQEACIAGILNDLAATHAQCVGWYEPRVMCLGKHIGLEGYASCAIQECLGITTLDECGQAYEILCSWTI